MRGFQGHAGAGCFELTTFVLATNGEKRTIFSAMNR
jgi:hypothetical protein